MNDTPRVRFAPSPTGHLHIGGARTAIYNWAFARGRNGAFILRIDDTDRERSTPENTEAILRALRWLGLDWDEGPGVGGDFGPHFQTQRAPLYAEALADLRSRGAAYPCFCTPEALEEKRVAARTKGGFSGYDRTCRAIGRDEALARADGGEPHVWRITVPEDRGDILIDDAIRGAVTFSAEAMDDFVLVRTDGTPTYNFATVVDDSAMGITHVIRGDDHLSNTPRQIVVFEALGAAVPTFAHMNLIFGPDGKRLSKRHGATSVEAYRDEGFLPEALLNYLALLGWSIDDKTTIFDRATLVSEFDLSRISKNPAIWDADKLEWMNGVYIREMSTEDLARRMAPALADAGLIPQNLTEDDPVFGLLGRLAPLVQERLKRLPDVVGLARFLLVSEESFQVDHADQERVLANESAAQVLDAAIAGLEALPDDAFTHEGIESVLRSLPESLGMKPKVVFQPIRVATSGSAVSLPLFESLELLGRARTLQRLRSARDQAVD